MPIDFATSGPAGAWIAAAFAAFSASTTILGGAPVVPDIGPFYQSLERVETALTLLPSAGVAAIAPHIDRLQAAAAAQATFGGSSPDFTCDCPTVVVPWWIAFVGALWPILNQCVNWYLRCPSAPEPEHADVAPISYTKPRDRRRSIADDSDEDRAIRAAEVTPSSKRRAR